MAHKETVREAVERYARENAYKASSRVFTGREFAERIRLRFAGDRRMEALQKAFRDYCCTIHGTEDGKVDAVFAWDAPEARDCGNAAFVW